MYDIIGDVKLRYYLKCLSVTNFVYTIIYCKVSCKIEISPSMNSNNNTVIYNVHMVSQMVQAVTRRKVGGGSKKRHGKNNTS